MMTRSRVIPARALYRTHTLLPFIAKLQRVVSISFLHSPSIPFLLYPHEFGFALGPPSKLLKVLEDLHILSLTFSQSLYWTYQQHSPFLETLSSLVF